MATDYSKLTNNNDLRKIDELCEKELPNFVMEFLDALSIRKSSKTLLSYARNIKLFFIYLMDRLVEFKHCENITDITEDLMKYVTLTDIEHFAVWMARPNNFHDEGNDSASVKQRLCSIKTFYKYLFTHKIVDENPAALVELPKLEKKAVIRLTYDEAESLLDAVEHGNELLETDRQKAYQKNTVTRDMAIVMLFLGTGMRVSELVGIDINHINWKQSSILIHRKENKEEILYFGDEVYEMLDAYWEKRQKITAVPGHEKAFFLSLQSKRMSVRSVERMVKKYASLVTQKHISCHKLRSTYGTNLYNETSDVLAVSRQLGHSSPAVTADRYIDKDMLNDKLKNKVNYRKNRKSDSIDDAK